MEVSIRKDLTILVLIGLVLNVAFLWFKNTRQKDLFLGVSLTHAQSAYNFCKYGSFHLNKNFSDYLGNLSYKENRLIDISDVPDGEKLAPDLKFPIRDTIGYSVVLAGLWKITGSFRFLDVQILQIFLYLISLILVYLTGLYLFKSRYVALFSTMALLLFFPITAMNVWAARDIWAYYGCVLFLYALSKGLRNKIKLCELIILAVGFSFCQWVRPPVFFILPTITVVLVIYGFFIKLPFNFFKVLTFFWFCSFFFFWIPFIAFNKINYRRCFVAPVGQDLFVSLGEYSNRWGVQLSDKWLIETITKIDSNLKYGTPEFDDKAKELFWTYFKEDPIFYFKSLLKRVPSIILPPLYWIYHNNSPYYRCGGKFDKLKCALSSPSMFLDFILRHLYVRFFILLGYIGFGLLLFKRKYLIFNILVFGILIGGLSKFPSHIEYRYIIPFWWVFSFGIGYLFAEIFNKINCIDID